MRHEAALCLVLLMYGVLCLHAGHTFVDVDMVKVLLCLRDFVRDLEPHPGHTRDFA